MTITAVSPAPPEMAAQTDAMSPLTQMLTAEFQRVNQRLDGIETHLAALQPAPPARNGHAPELFSDEIHGLTQEEMIALEPLLDQFLEAAQCLDKAMDKTNAESAALLAELRQPLRAQAEGE